MAWQQLTLRLTAAELPRTEALLRLLGAEAVSISDDSGTPILEPAPGTEPLWDALTVKALFAGDVDLGATAALLGTKTKPAITTLSDDDWQAGWRQSVEPIRVGARLKIVPAEQPVSSDDELALHMGLAFGTGRHPTTLLCLKWIERRMPAGLDVLDYGAGSGILALAALKLGARSAVAIDNDPQALVAARRNAELNGLASAVSIGAPDALPERQFDLIFANILAAPLFEFADRFAAHHAAGGPLVLSGILEEQVELITERYARHYDAMTSETLDGWAVITAIRRSDG